MWITARVSNYLESPLQLFITYTALAGLVWVWFLLELLRLS